MASKVLIRLARAEDAPALASIYAPSVVGAVTSFEVEPPSAAEMARRCERVQATLPWLVCEIDGDVRGYAYASPHNERAAYQWSCDSSVYVEGESLRRGVARALYTVLFEIVRLQGYCAVHAGITLPNPASEGLHQAFGFRPVGVYRAVGYKLGAWRDVGWWQLELRERIAEPPPIVKPADLRRERAQAWDGAFAAGHAVLATADSGRL